MTLVKFIAVGAAFAMFSVAADARPAHHRHGHKHHVKHHVKHHHHHRHGHR